MISTNTLGEHLDRGDCISAHCNDQFCRHSVDLDLAALAERLGRDFVIVGNPNPLAARLSCSKCGGKDIGLIFAPAGRPTSVGSHSQSR